jgi:putative drug exporter of the RND superfamily
MAGSKSVVTSAGIVFAVTMWAFVFSGFQVLGQIGATIGLGLLFDTLIVHSFMTRSVATLLERWFWWPQQVSPRPASQMLRPYGPRSAPAAAAVGRRRPSGYARTLAGSLIGAAAPSD